MKVKCSNCRELVPDKVDQCPECGADVDRQPRTIRFEEVEQGADGTWWWRVWVNGQVVAGPFPGYREKSIAAAAAKCWYPLNGLEE